MEKRTLGRTNLKVSIVGFGGIPIQRVPGEEATKVIHACLEEGINFFDTARAYSDSEEKIGLALKNVKNKPYLATKAPGSTKEELNQHLETSLKNLGVEKIDLYQMHNVATEERLKTILGKDGALQGLIEARESGKVDFIGVTGHKPEILIQAIRTGKFDTVQFPLNAIEHKRYLKILEEANKHNVGTIIMKPFAGGALQNIGTLKFIMQYDIDVIIPGMDTVEQVRKNVEAARTKITEKEAAELKKETDKLGKDFCRMCEYCMPCPKGINIPLTMNMDAYYHRYGLTEWAKNRYKNMPGA
ncbi:MAG: aldo/keto reductase, partial [Candidatus Woesearchaeota archaeon]